MNTDIQNMKDRALDSDNWMLWIRLHESQWRLNRFLEYINERKISIEDQASMWLLFWRFEHQNILKSQMIIAERMFEVYSNSECFSQTLDRIDMKSDQKFPVMRQANKFEKLGASKMGFVWNMNGNGNLIRFATKSDLICFIDFKDKAQVIVKHETLKRWMKEKQQGFEVVGL